MYILQTKCLIFLFYNLYFCYQSNMNKLSKITLGIYVLCITCVGVMCSMNAMAQKSDSIYYSTKSKKIGRTPQIKANIQPYRPVFGFIPYNNILLNGNKSGAKPDKLLTVLKVYPNPIDDQINVTLKLERESNLSIKIMDLLGNEVITLTNERAPSGEITKSFTIPNRLNSGIYFLRVMAGAETSVKRISVL